MVVGSVPVTPAALWICCFQGSSDLMEIQHSVNVNVILKTCVFISSETVQIPVYYYRIYSILFLTGLTVLGYMHSDSNWLQI